MNIIDEDIIYAYPESILDEENEVSDENFFISSGLNKSGRLKIFVLTALLTVFLLLYCIPAFESIDYIFLFTAAVLAVFLYLFVKQIGRNLTLTMTSILALREKMSVIFHCGSLKPIMKELEVYYEDIETARFLDGNYTKLEIIFKQNGRSFARETNMLNGFTTNIGGAFFFSVREFSYEQFFFLYIAEDLFTMKKLHKTKRFYKRFGNKREYLERLERINNG